MILDIGVGKVPLGDINVDLVANPLCNIMADIQHLPFRDSSFSKIICKAVLEHIDDPEKGLSEIRRVLTRRGSVKIGLPMKKYTNNSFYYFVFFILNFPFTLSPKYIKTLFNKIKQIKNRDVALYHKYIVTCKIVSNYFKIEKVIEYGDILYSFLNYGRKSKYFKNKPRINTAYLFLCVQKCEGYD